MPMAVAWCHVRVCVCVWRGMCGCVSHCSGASGCTHTLPRVHAALPFLHRTVLLLYPGLIAVGVYFVALLLNWNISRSLFHYYGLQEGN